MIWPHSWKKTQGDNLVVFTLGDLCKLGWYLWIAFCNANTFTKHSSLSRLPNNFFANLCSMLSHQDEVTGTINGIICKRCSAFRFQSSLWQSGRDPETRKSWTDPSTPGLERRRRGPDLSWSRKLNLGCKRKSSNHSAEIISVQKCTPAFLEWLGKTYC